MKVLETSRGHARNNGFRPIKKVDMTLEVAERIKEMLQAGILKPGSKLPTERELVELLQISRPSLREALKALCFMGLIRSRRGTGTYISNSAVDILSRPLEFLPLLQSLPMTELFEARRLVEVKVAGLAAKRATEDDIAGMRSALDACGRYLDKPSKFVIHEIQFHKAVYSAAGNSVLCKAMDILYQILNEFRVQSVAAVKNLREMLEYHERIYEAIVDRNPEEAVRAMEKHFQYSEAVLKREGLLAAANGLSG
jgi:GntR family transcriptional regulator, transcriptional repressor for pyruvate dehydrogenase complex